jgi:hypothetical protein
MRLVLMASTATAVVGSGEIADAATQPQLATGQAAARVMQQYVQALGQKDIDAALAHVLEPGLVQSQMQLLAQTDQLAELVSRGELEVEVIEYRVRGQWAVLATRQTLYECDEQTGERTVVREALRDVYLHHPGGAGSTWKYVPTRALEDEVIRSLADSDLLWLREWFRSWADDE